MYEPAHLEHAGRLSDFFILVEQAFARIVGHDDHAWPLPGFRRVRAGLNDAPYISINDRDSHARGPALDDLVSTLRSASYWNDDEAWGRIAGLLPEYRLSKFQDVLPEAFAQEMTSDALLDRSGTRAFLCGR